MAIRDENLGNLIIVDTIESGSTSWSIQDPHGRWVHVEYTYNWTGSLLSARNCMPRAAVLQCSGNPRPPAL